MYYSIYAFSIETQPWTVLAFAYYYCILLLHIFAFSVSLLNMRSLLYLLYVCFLLKCDYLFCNYPLSLFVILRLELHVYIMLTFMFCEINDIWYMICIYNPVLKNIHNHCWLFKVIHSSVMYHVWMVIEIGKETSWSFSEMSLLKGGTSFSGESGGFDEYLFWWEFLRPAWGHYLICICFTILWSSPTNE